MQIIPSISIIEENDRKQIYLQILSDQFCMKIISCIIDDAKTAVQIAKEVKAALETAGINIVPLSGLV